MNAKIHSRLNDSASARWMALGAVSFTMMAAFFVNDIMAPLKSMLESDLSWSSTDFGFFTGAYSFLNVFLLMIIWGGLILDRFGIRFTGKLATILMVAGTAVEYWALNHMTGSAATILGYKADVFVASAGYAVFGVGAEVAGITVTKIVAKWFKGKEMATAMGVQVALSRLGSQAAYSVAIPIARNANLSTPLFIGLLLLVVGMVAFFVFTFMDRKLDRQIADETTNDSNKEEKFKISDMWSILADRGFWLIALLCLLFYSCIFPFQKFATELFIDKYGLSENLSGTIAGLPALGALILTPFFGGMIDRRGKAASMMILGSAMLIFTHALYAIPSLHASWIAVGLMIVLGISFSLVPSAMWPSIAKIFPSHKLGTAYALIFFIQNIGLWGVPYLIGDILDRYGVVSRMGGESVYDYTIPMLLFSFFAIMSLILAVMLKETNRRKGYGLEQPNIKK